MSTNYYFKLKDSVVNKMKEVNSAFDVFVPEYFGGQEFGMLHIGKRSGSWKPMFQETDWYGSVKEIKHFYDQYKDVVNIIDEYGKILSWSQLEEEFINWKGERSHLNPSDYDYIDDSLLKHVFKDEEGYEFIKGYFY